jgi:hypothetical protein
MLGSVVARHFAMRGATVWTTEERYDGSDAVPSWAARFDLAINCIRSDDWREMVDLPAHLALVTRVIQPSTDAIHEDTAYAQMKREAERVSAVIIRAGIIDVNRQPATAYASWKCNPLTPLEWARVAWRLRRAKPGIYQFGREPTDRAEIARLVARLWDRPEPQIAQGIPNDRILASPWTFPPLEVALAEYRKWL